MVKGNLTEVRDLGMQVNRHNSNELVDHCILKFQTEDGEEYFTESLSKTCHASSKLGKIIRTLLRRNLTKEDYITDDDGNELFDSTILLEKSAYVEIGNNNKITEVGEGP
jgi:hypothetical protein